MKCANPARNNPEFRAARKTRRQGFSGDGFAQAVNQPVSEAAISYAALSAAKMDWMDDASGGKKRRKEAKERK